LPTQPAITFLIPLEAVVLLLIPSLLEKYLNQFQFGLYVLTLS